MHYYGCLIFFCVTLSPSASPLYYRRSSFGTPFFVINLNELLKRLEMTFLSKHEFFHNATKGAKYLPGHSRDWSWMGNGERPCYCYACVHREIECLLIFSHTEMGYGDTTSLLPFTPSDADVKDMKDIRCVADLYNKLNATSVAFGINCE